MELLLLAVPAPVAGCALAVRHHLQVVAWDRELDHASGASAVRDVSRGRAL